MPIDLRAANLQGLDLSDVDFDKARLDGVEMQWADLFGAAVDYADVGISQTHVDDLFYDVSVTFAPDINCAAGREVILDRQDFDRQWHAWQEKTGDEMT